jgi:hypothetical protein
MSEQNFKNHGRIDPTFHFVLFGILFVNLIAGIVHLVRHPNLHMVWFVVLSVTALIFLFKMRLYAMKVQDRVIRLEERMRLQALAPSEWHTQIYRLSIDQLIGLRFAADEEVVELAKHALEHGLNRKQIKERIKSWRADDWRV